jgi:putative ABC transport system substrate-binding protein
MIRRREFVAVLGGTAAAWPLTARAQQPKMPLIGWLNGGTRSEDNLRVIPFREGLKEAGYVEGRNVATEYRWAGGQYDRLPALAAELVPGVTTIGFLMNPDNLISEGTATDVRAAARSVGQEIVVLNASTADEIDKAFATAGQRGIGALLVAVVGLLFFSRRTQFAVLAASHKLPAIHDSRAYVEAGGLLSYGDDRADSYRQAGLYVGRILKGEKPADLPVLQPTKFEFSINLRTANALGITFPPSFRLRADHVIE